MAWSLPRGVPGVGALRRRRERPLYGAPEGSYPDAPIRRHLEVPTFGAALEKERPFPTDRILSWIIWVALNLTL